MCQANKQFSAVNPVICKVSLAGERFSAVTLIIGKVCLASKQFFAFIPVFMYGFRQVSRFLRLLRLFVKLVW